MKKTFVSVFKGGVLAAFPAGPVIMEHQMSVFRPAWTSTNLCAAGDLHGVRKANGSGITKDYFNKSKGLWYGWK